jgi:hypothetical protein
LLLISIASSQSRQAIGRDACYRHVKRTCDGWDTNPIPMTPGVPGFPQTDSFGKRAARRMEPGPGWGGKHTCLRRASYSFCGFKQHSIPHVAILTLTLILALCSHARSHSQPRIVRCLQLNAPKAPCAADGSRAVRGPPLESIPVPRHQGLAWVPQIASPNRSRCPRCSTNSDCCLLSTKLEIATTPTPTSTTSRTKSRCIFFPSIAMFLR